MGLLNVEHFCPLGSDCEELVGKTIKRCAWYTKIVGTDPSSEKEIEDWACAMSWMPILQVEMSKTNRESTASLDSLRNETVKGQEEFNKTIRDATTSSTQRVWQPTTVIGSTEGEE